MPNFPKVERNALASPSVATLLFKLLRFRKGLPSLAASLALCPPPGDSKKFVELGQGKGLGSAQVREGTSPPPGGKAIPRLIWVTRDTLQD